MSDNPKDLQKLRENEAVTLEWSTISNVHGTQMLEAENADLVSKLQSLNSSEGPVLLEWSTISNVHLQE